MGRVYALSGPSGVGKTTFLQAVIPDAPSNDLRLLARYTDRPRRPEERDGFEYYFTPHRGILQKVFANDFIHVERWGSYYSAIEARVIEETLQGEYDGVVLASTFGAARLQATYGSDITSVYMWTDSYESLRNPRCLEDDAPEVTELKWRIDKKLREERFSDFEVSSLDPQAFISSRMIDNYLDIAAVNGRLCSGEDVTVLSNPHDKLEEAVSAFSALRSRLVPVGRTARARGGGVFVLMPFRDELKPVYEDHIRPACEDQGLRVLRADGIFSTQPFMDDIREAVVTARIVIADLTDGNPNVFYEVGICHALDKDVILITQDSTVPADLGHIRRIRYEFTPNGMKRFEQALAHTIANVLQTPKGTRTVAVGR
jgi:guanylate kinase